MQKISISNYRHYYKLQVSFAQDSKTIATLDNLRFLHCARSSV